MRTRVSNTRGEKGDNLILEFMFHQKQSTVLSVKSQFVCKITALPSFNSVPLEISIIIIMNMGCNKTLPGTTTGNPNALSRGGGVLPYIGYIGICCCKGYGFQAVYSRIAYINQSVWV